MKAAQLPTTSIGSRFSAKGVAIFVVVVVIAALIALAWHYQPGIHHIKAAISVLRAYGSGAPLRLAALFFAANLAVTTFCIPIEILFGLAAGALFGLVEGTALVSFASSIGAMLAFWGSRFLLRDTIRRSFAKRLETVDAGMQRDGAFFLFSMRLLPVVPFAVVNIVMGLTNIPARKFYWVSQAGMLPATLVYVNAGTQIAKLNSLSGILSPSLIGAFVLIALLPWAAKGLLALRRRRA